MDSEMSAVVFIMARGMLEFLLEIELIRREARLCYGRRNGDFADKSLMSPALADRFFTH